MNIYRGIKLEECGKRYFFFCMCFSLMIVILNEFGCIFFLCEIKWMYIYEILFLFFFKILNNDMRLCVDMVCGF